MDLLSKLFVLLPFLLKIPDVLQVVLLFINLWVPKLYTYSTFHTPPSLHPDVLQDQK
jgi:hypothetical protein